MDNTYIIAEIGINHNGDEDLAERLILQAKNSGCDAVKFQKRAIDVVYSRDELNTPRESPFGTTTREQKEGIEFGIEQYDRLEEYSNQLGLDFIVSCWDEQSVDLIEDFSNVRYHKVASALVTNRSFLKKLNQTGKPIILSTGMCTDEQVDKAVDTLDNIEYILACTSTYPTVAKEVNLRYIQTLKNKYPDIKIGFSNHYNGIDACVGSVVLGAECIEFHITNDRTSYGSDQAASIQDADDLVHAVRMMELMIGDGVKRVYDSEQPIIKKLRKPQDMFLH